MNRRDLLKKVAAVPIAAAVAPLVVAETLPPRESHALGFMVTEEVGDGVALNSIAHPVLVPPPFNPPSQELFDLLNEASLETVEIELEMSEHEFTSLEHEFCIHCGASAAEVIDGRAPSCFVRNAHGSLLNSIQSKP